MRLQASEKLEVIRLVEGSELSARRTLKELGVPRSTFYSWSAIPATNKPRRLAPQRPSVSLQILRDHWGS